jgi:hypothetical protein
MDARQEANIRLTKACLMSRNPGVFSGLISRFLFMYRLNIYIPESHLEVVKSALFAAGAGRLGLYETCAWQTKGEGQFKPMSGSQPFIGESGSLERVDEYKVEMLCAAEHLKAVLNALKASHPYEEPAFDVYQALDVDALF